ncbi:MAG: AraC family transcriptional regulator [Paenibacillus sp.]|nr:AraC family transcriptional regulator [Paenibacillus sp.]
MEARVVTLPRIHLVGYRLEATVEAFESGLGKNAYRSLLERGGEIPGRKNNHVLLLQMYPPNPDFNVQTDPFTHLLGYEVGEPDHVPAHMASHTVGESKCVTCTHKGPESELS